MLCLCGISKLCLVSALESVSVASNDIAPAAGICSAKKEEEKEDGCWPFLFPNMHGLKKEEFLVGFDLDYFGSCKLLTACCGVCVMRYFQFHRNLMLKKSKHPSLNSKKNKAAGQEMAADNFQLACACLFSRRSFKELDSPHRGS